MKSAREFPPAPDVGQPSTKSPAKASTVVVKKKSRYRSVDLNVKYIGRRRGGKALTGSEGWNVVRGEDGKINALSNCKQVFKTDIHKYTELLSP